MAISKNDLVITVSMLIALIVVNVIVVEAGLASDQVKEDEIPDLNLSKSNFSLVGDRPTQPLAPKEFRMSQFADVGSGSGHRLNSSTLVLISSTASECTYQISHDTGTGTETSSVSISRTNGSDGRVSLGDWELEFVITNDIGCTAIGDVISSPGGKSGIFEGFIGDTADAIAGVFDGIIYLGQTAVWIIGVMIEGIFNVASVSFSIAGFGIGFLSWAFGTYLDLTASAGSWASLALTVPVVGLSVMFMKIGISIIGASNWL